MTFEEVEFRDFEEFRNHDGRVKISSSPSLQGREGQIKEISSQDLNKMKELEDREDIMETEDFEDNFNFCVKSQDNGAVEYEDSEEVSDESDDSEEEMEDEEENDDNKWDFDDIKQEKKSEEVFQINLRLLIGKNDKIRCLYRVKWSAFSRWSSGPDSA